MTFLCNSTTEYVVHVARYGSIFSTCTSLSTNVQLSYYLNCTLTDNTGARVLYLEIKVVDNASSFSKIAKALSMLSQEVSPETKGTVIYVYEDGTIERSFTR